MKNRAIKFIVILFFYCSLVSVNLANGQFFMPAPASKSSWHKLPQYQPEVNSEYHWYALENEHNPVYWDNVDTKRIIICLKVYKSVNAIAPLIEKYKLGEATTKSMYPEVINFYTFNVPNGSKDKILEIVKDAKQNYSNDIEFVEPESIITSESCSSNDPYNYPNTGYKQWSISTLGIDSAWCYVVSSSNHILGIIDNALDYMHSEFYGIYEHDFADGDASVLPDGTGTQTHGTHVAGIAGARINNSIGMAGVTNDTIYFAKAVKDGATLFDNTAVINAINDMAIFSKVRVINMSFGSKVPNAAIQAACDYAWSMNKLLIAASGNDTANLTRYPAGYSSVISVGSVGVNTSTLAVTFSSNFSNYGAKQEITAAGGNGDGSFYDIWSTMPSNSYGQKAGTSMAAPLVAGVAELMFDINPSLTNSDARTILQYSVYDLGVAGRDDYYGYGVICGWCAVINARDFVSPPPSLKADLLPNSEGKVIPYPNPSTGIVNFKFQDNTSENVEVSIFNSIGTQVYHFTSILSSNTLSADLSAMPTGTYYAKIKSPSFEQVKSISILK